MASGRIPAWFPQTTTRAAAGALTVAGQRRIFTVFPNILVSLGDFSARVNMHPAQDGAKKEADSGEDSTWHKAIQDPNQYPIQDPIQEAISGSLCEF